MKRLFLLFSFTIAAIAQQNAVMLPWTPQQFTNTNGALLVSGKVCTYLAGTSTGTATFTDATASVQNAIPPNAILLDSTARPTSGGIWLIPSRAYKIVTMTAGSDNTCNTGVVVKTQDNVLSTSATAALKSALADGIYYVGTLGSDANDGLSVGTAKATIPGAQAACIANQIGNCIIHAETLRSQVFSSEIDVGRQAEDLHVTLYLPRDSVYTFNMTDGVSCGIKQFGKTSIIVDDTPLGNATMLLVPANNTTNMQALYCTNPSPVATGSYINVKGLAVRNTVGATLVRGAFVIQHLFDNSRIENIHAENDNGVAIKVFDTCCGASIWNAEGVNAHGTGGFPIVIGDSVLGGSVAAGGVQDMGFNSVSAIDPPSGTSPITFGDTTGHTAALTFTNLHVEAPNSTAPGMQLVCNVVGVTVLGMTYANLPGGDTTSAAIDVPNCANAPYDFFTGMWSATSVGVNDHTQVTTTTCVVAGFLNACPSYYSSSISASGSVNLAGGKFTTNGTGGIAVQILNNNIAVLRGSGSSGDNDFIDLGNITFRDSNGTNGGSLKMTGSLSPSAAGGTDLGTTALPFGNLWLGSSSTSQFKFAPSTTTAARVVTIPDPGSNSNLSLTPCITSQRTETAADANLLTCVLPTQAGSYRIRFMLTVSAANAATLGWTATWTDSNAGAEVPTNLPVTLLTSGGASGTPTPALTITTSAAGDAIEGYADIDVNTASTIVVKLTFSGTSFTGKASASVERII